ncbi:YpdA family putative bacillithiol disulfide reductase [Alkalicoccus urumqiensis]|uniref:YpdA family putative bacillithiol disulfide reductase n=1 Tax=Alkalicoccus urumqiensis TaxID=1548213 RepID=A0A2P6MKH4_ALKUR|nr:YpdA family putative bacillithiol disulfide reductase [Alkalicoccus urumqiensis]PRO66790.1 YpdA family putative bacillithiol disulfide reductase [Alkalicoccus urumqiensis]
MQHEKVIIVGAGPCGIAAAAALQDLGMDPLLIERGNIVHAIYKYPTHQQFFSTSEKLSVGGIPFYSTERKPKRNEALVYYRKVAEERNLRIRSYEEVTSIKKGSFFQVETDKRGETYHYAADYIIAATGYYASPNLLQIEGEEKPHVYHYFHEGHPYFNQKVVVIGGKNSAVDTALELDKAGADVTVVYRGSTYSKSIKPWVLPEFEAQVRSGNITMHFDAEVEKIESEHILIRHPEGREKLEADFVFAMTGYHPDHGFLQNMGVETDPESGRPVFDSETMETNVSGIFIAGVIAAGNNANEIFIENGRWHGGQIAQAIAKREAGTGTKDLQEWRT